MSTFSHWIDAARPKTLPAAVAPVLLGGALAWRHADPALPPFLVALFCAVLIQIGTNFANDYYDARKGADTPDRVGFVRATASGLLAPSAVLRATWICMGLAFLAGLYLVWIGGWPILAIGVSGILFGILYTGGPYPLGYNGLGDLFVFLYFGLAAVMGTTYVLTGTWLVEAFWVALVPGALSVNILVVNNLRDIHTDRLAGKRTLGVLFGERLLQLEYTGLVLLAAAIPPHLWVREGYDGWILAPLLTLPLLSGPLRSVWTHADKSELNATLARTAAFMALYCALLAAMILLRLP